LLDVTKPLGACSVSILSFKFKDMLLEPFKDTILDPSECDLYYYMPARNLTLLPYPSFPCKLLSDMGCVPGVFPEEVLP
jgi:hypothetical protein